MCLAIDFFCQLAFGNVFKVPDRAGVRPLGVDCLARNTHPKWIAIVPNLLHFCRVGRPACHFGVGDVAGIFPRGFVVVRETSSLTDQFVDFVAVNFSHPLVATLDDPVFDEGDTDRAVVENQLLFA